MNELRIALAQMDFTVGALGANAERIVRCAREAAEAGADVVAFPELALSGYPPEDLVLKPHFLRDCEAALRRLARQLPRDIVVVAGSPTLERGRARNSAIVFARGKIIARYAKMALPNYGVFDEKRVFAAGGRALVLDLAGARIGIHICEDSWDLGGRACTDLRGAGLDVLLNISASPYHRGKLSVRRRTLAATAALLKAPLLYCNLVGGQDELVFDGASLAIGRNGKLLARAKQFEEEILYVQLPVRGGRPTPAFGHASAGGDSGGGRVAQVVDFPTLGKIGENSSKDWKNSVAPALEDPAEVYAALRLGLKDYVEKNGFRRVVVALSGGIDSALVATLAVDALGAGRVAGVTMPSAFSSAATRGDAARLARNLGIEFHSVGIRRLHESYLRELARLWKGRPADITEENLQARIRGNIVMALSNKFGWLVLTTGNKSELATGYCTLYGDMAGGFAVIKDVPKTLVFELSRWRNRQGRRPVIPPSTIRRPPTAELRPNQRDTDSLPPYEVLDPILERYIERDWSAGRIIAGGFAPMVVRRVVRLVDRSEYKRRQGAPGIKITPKAFGRDRRMPITNLYGEGT